MFDIALTQRQHTIVDIIKNNGPITGEQIAEKLNLTRAALRPDLAILVMCGLIDARPKVGYYYSGKTGLTLVSEEIASLLVKDIQSIPVVISISASVYDAVVMLFLEDVGSIYVVEQGGILVGVVSRKDLLKATLGKNDFQTMPIKMIMTPLSKLVVATSEESALVAAKRMIEHEVDSLPVIKSILNNGIKQYEVIGRVTKTNITKLFVEIGEGQRR